VHPDDGEVAALDEHLGEVAGEPQSFHVAPLCS
jgi:hypothetical protein